MKTRAEYMQDIVTLVTNIQGCKATELPVILAEAYDSRDEDHQLPEDFVAIVDELIKSGKLVEVSYVLPNLPNREKSFLLPPGTQIV
jgi:hypothetical protein